MGSSSSKAARSAARKFPARAPQAVPPRAGKPQTQRTPREPDLKTEAPDTPNTDPDAVTGDFSRRLQEMGIVQPNPTFSPSSTAGPAIPDAPTAPLGPMFPPARNNATLSVLQSRRQLQQQAEEELKSMSLGTNRGRRFVDMRTLVEIMQLRGRGYPSSDIEQRLRLQPGLLNRLGQPRLLSHASSD